MTLFLRAIGVTSRRCGEGASGARLPCRTAKTPCERCVNGAAIKRGINSKVDKMNDQAKKLVRGHVSASGRLSLPAEFRKAVGLEQGGDVVVELDNREIRIRTLDDTIA